MRKRGHKRPDMHGVHLKIPHSLYRVYKLAATERTGLTMTDLVIMAMTQFPYTGSTREAAFVRKWDAFLLAAEAQEDSAEPTTA